MYSTDAELRTTEMFAAEQAAAAPGTATRMLNRMFARRATTRTVGIRVLRFGAEGADAYVMLFLSAEPGDS
jgi:hypothetical protein